MWVMVPPLMVIGAGLLVIGLRGRRTNDHPVCRKCRFDLHGVYPEHDRCPECGSALTAHAIRQGVRRRRPRVAALGAISILAGLTLGAAIGWSAATGFDFNSIKPGWLLTRELTSPDATTANSALAELEQRLEDDRLSADVTSRAIEQVLAVQARPIGPWDLSWAEFVDVAQTKGLLSDEQFRRYYRGAVMPEIRTRPRLRVGDDLVVQYLSHRPRLGVGRSIFVSWRMLAASIDETELPPIHGSIGSGTTIYGPGSGYTASSTRVRTGDLGLPTGIHRVRILVELTVSESSTSATTPLHLWTIEHTADVDVIPPDAQDIMLITDPDQAGAVRAALQPRDCRVEVRGGKLHAEGYIEVWDVPVAIAFDVIWRVDGGEWGIGSVSCRSRSRLSPTKDTSRVVNWFRHPQSLHFSGEVIEFPSTDTIDLVLFPNPGNARQAVGLDTIWGETIIFEGVPVQWPDPPTP
jgi:hypothetical protein